MYKYFLSRYTHSAGFVRKYLEQQMSDVYKTQTTQTDEMVILVLQSLEVFSISFVPNTKITELF